MAMETEKAYENMQQVRKYERSAGYIFAQILKFILHYVVLFLKAAGVIFINVLKAFGVPIGK